MERGHFSEGGTDVLQRVIDEIMFGGGGGVFETRKRNPNARRAFLLHYSWPLNSPPRIFTILSGEFQGKILVDVDSLPQQINPLEENFHISSFKF